MITALLAHGLWSYLGVFGVFALVVAGLFFLGGLPLLLNRFVLPILAAVLVGLFGMTWWENEKESLREEGRVQGRAEIRSQVEAANKKAQAEREALIASNEKETSRLLGESGERLAAALKQLEIERAKRKPRVSLAADARCVVPLGFVRDHDAALPGPAGGSAVLDGGADDDRASGIPLSVASAQIGKNYAVARACLARLAESEERRYRLCLAWDAKFGTRSGCKRSGEVAPKTP